MRFVVLLAASLVAVAAHAQTPAGPINLYGTLVEAQDASLTIEPETGGRQTFRVAPDALVLQNRSVTLADIKPNDFVASAAMRGPDGKLHSTELRVFPEALRGLGEGQRAMNDARNQTMTNATVTGTAIVDGSNRITVKFAGGESELVLDPGVPVTRIEPIERSALKPGLSVRLQGARDADGGRVTRITVQ